MKRIGSFFLALLLVIGVAYMAPPAEAAGKKLIAITFDDGPYIYTDGLLDGLKARGVKATFFMVGNRLSTYSSTVSRMYREGHQLANHSYDHSDLDTLSAAGVRSQIQTTNSLLDKVCGTGAKYMVRAPYGNSNATVKQAVGAPLIYWSMDPQDWLYRDAERVKNHVVSHAYDGAIILLHDIHPTSVTAALGAIDILKAQGYEFVTMAEMFRRRGMAAQNGVVYRNVLPTGTDLGPVTTPVITSQPAGDKLQITITAQSGASIYYTANGGELNQSSQKYTGPFLVSTPCTVKAVAAYNMNGSRSDTAEVTFKTPVTAAPDITVKNGTLTLSSATSGAEIYCSVGTAGFRKYTGPMAVRPGTEIAAYAQRQGYLTSATSRASYSTRGHLFRDLFPGDWYYEDMDAGVTAGYINGVGGDKYDPMGKLQRGQLITMLYRFSGEKAPAGAIEAMPFADVPKDAYYAEAVAWAYANKIVDGTGPGSFSPGRPVTRQEMSKMFYGYLRTLNITLPDSTGAAGKYTDRDRIAPWAYKAVEQMTAVGLLAGENGGRFNPTGQSNRAQGVTVLVRLAKLLEDQEPEPSPEPDPEPEPEPDSDIPESTPALEMPDQEPSQEEQETSQPDLSETIPEVAPESPSEPSVPEELA